jgi:hemoglobin
MKTIKLLSVFVLALIITNCSEGKKQKEVAINENITEAMHEKPVEKSLFDRLGGDKGIATIVDGIVAIHLENPEINHLFIPLTKDPVHLENVKKHLREFLSSGTGGNAVYSGKDLPTAHKGMQITENEFLSATDDILTVLSANNIDEETKKDMLYILYTLKGAVIRK